MISSQWVLGEASALGVKVSDAEVKKQFEKIKTQQFPSAAEFEKFLASSGQTVSDLLLRVKLNLLSPKIQQKIPRPRAKSPRRRSEVLQRKQIALSVPEKRNVEIILTKTEAAAKAAKKEVESGKSFSSVARRRRSTPARPRADCSVK